MVPGERQPGQFMISIDWTIYDTYDFLADHKNIIHEISYDK